MAGYGMCTLTKKTKQLASAIFQVYSHALFPAGSSAAQTGPVEAAAGATGGSNRSAGLQGGSLSTVVLCLSEDTKLFPMLPKISEEIFSKNEDASITQALTTTLINETQPLSK